MNQKLMEVAEENRRLREALGFYADKENWKRKKKPDEHWEFFPAISDGGEVARGALHTEGGGGE